MPGPRQTAPPLPRTPAKNHSDRLCVRRKGTSGALSPRRSPGQSTTSLLVQTGVKRGSWSGEAPFSDTNADADPWTEQQATSSADPGWIGLGSTRQRLVAPTKSTQGNGGDGSVLKRLHGLQARELCSSLRTLQESWASQRLSRRDRLALFARTTLLGPLKKVNLGQEQLPGQTAWREYSCTDPTSRSKASLCCSPDAAGVTATRLRLKRAGKEPSVEDVALLMLGAAAAWKLPAVQVRAGTVKTAQRTEVRIVVPTHNNNYRHAYVPEPEQ